MKRKCCKACSTGGGGDCSNCNLGFPAVSPGNMELLEVVDICPGLWLRGMDGPTGINLAHVVLLAERIGVDTDEAFFIRLREYEQIVLELTYKK